MGLRTAPFDMVLAQVAGTLHFVAIAAYLIPANHGVGLTQAYAASAAINIVIGAVWVLLIIRRMPRSVSTLETVSAAPSMRHAGDTAHCASPTGRVHE